MSKILMTLHPLTNIYYQNEPKFNRVKRMGHI